MPPKLITPLPDLAFAMFSGSPGAFVATLKSSGVLLGSLGVLFGPLAVAWGSLGGNLRSLGGHTCRQVSPLWLQYRMKADKAKMLEKRMKNNDF